MKIKNNNNFFDIYLTIYHKTKERPFVVGGYVTYDRFLTISMEVI
jgi:hypothetical protein